MKLVKILAIGAGVAVGTYGLVRCIAGNTEKYNAQWFNEKLDKLENIDKKDDKK